MCCCPRPGLGVMGVRLSVEVEGVVAGRGSSEPTGSLIINITTGHGAEPIISGAEEASGDLRGYLNCGRQRGCPPRMKRNAMRMSFCAGSA